MPKYVVPLATASLAQLREYATATLGLEIGPGNDATDIRSLIMTAAPEITDLTVTTASEPDAPKAVYHAAAKPLSPAVLIDHESEQSGRADAIAVINIAVGAGKIGQAPVYVNVNGTAILIPRGKDVPVPYRYYATLKNATRVEYDQDDDERGHPGPLVPRVVPEYPVSLVRIEPAKSEAA